MQWLFGGIEEYLKEANNQLDNKEFYQELAINIFEDHQIIIINSLNEMLSNNIIDKETSIVLKPINVKQAHFYLFPKIHKVNNPGRLVISSVNYHTTKLTNNIDHYINPLGMKVKSHIRGTTYLLNKIKHIAKYRVMQSLSLWILGPYTQIYSLMREYQS